MYSKEAGYDLAILRLGVLDASPLIISFGKKISSEFTKPQRILKDPQSC